MKVNGKNLRVGDKVRIAQDCREGAPATGQEATYEGRCWTRNGLRYRGPRCHLFSVNPKFRLPDGKVIWGIECYWLPITQALEVEASVRVDPPPAPASLG